VRLSAYTKPRIHRRNSNDQTFSGEIDARNLNWSIYSYFAEHEGTQDCGTVAIVDASTWRVARGFVAQ